LIDEPIRRNSWTVPQKGAAVVGDPDELVEEEARDEADELRQDAGDEDPGRIDRQ